MEAAAAVVAAEAEVENEDGDSSCGDVCFMDKGLQSISELSLDSTLHAVNLHCNNISKIEAIDHIWNLQHLDLSSNQISRIEGLNTLTKLCTLNLSCNLITKVEGLEELINLTRLNVSYNHIDDLSGLIPLHGIKHKLRYIDLHSNRIDSIHHLLQCMVGLHFLTNLILEKDGDDNPVCRLPGTSLNTVTLPSELRGYRAVILQTLPQLRILDCKNIFGEPVNLTEINSSQLQCLEGLLDNLVSSDSPLNISEDEIIDRMPVITAPIDELVPLEQFASTPSDAVLTSFMSVCQSSEPEKNNHENDLQNEIKLQKLDDQILQLLNETSNSIDNVLEKDPRPKRDTDITSESDYGNRKECNRKVPRRSKIPYDAKTIQTIKHHNKNYNSFVSCNRKMKPPYLKELYVSSSLANCPMLQESEKPKTEIIKVDQSHSEDNTYQSLVEQLDQEREKRWRAEQAENKLMDYIDELHKHANEKEDIHSLALLTTDRLKEIIFRERNSKGQLEVMVHKLQNEIKKLTVELMKAKDQQEDHLKHLRTLEKTLEKMERQKRQQQAAQIRLIQEVELKASAADREIYLLRTSLHREREQAQQLHQLLALKEQEHRKELETREFFTDADFQDALAKEIAKEEKKHEQMIKEYQEKIDVLSQQYMDLENEFRIALTVEARRFQDVRIGTQLFIENRINLTCMVKEQKTKLAEVSKLKQETAANLQNQINTLEILIEDDKQKSIQIELLKHEKVQLISELAAKESLIFGLRTERKVWGHELAQQGSSLAQNRGKLEAQIESLSRENECLRKTNESDSDALRIKCKIIDDQTETIRKLKDCLQEKDEHIKRLQEKITEIEKCTQEQLDEKSSQLDEVLEKLERHNERKEKLKQQLKGKEVELEEIRKAYSTLNRKWHDKGELLCHLETQVKEVKEKFENKEKKLKAERDKSIELQKNAMEKLHSMDDAFKRQVDAIVEAHQAEIAQLANEKQKCIDSANLKVHQIEKEMRELLEETCKNKKTMEAKIKQLAFALNEIQQDM
ncbi:leucine-rich repeat and coiled-coil domain-containing protein 1 isoform X2 [Homo sapiens]|uniref:leucine-rich repeat and coiled-coil domain-containing protein 1 isoform X2 n=1 Tax=Homo sapiens TaxID=9606 RepID=UPI0007DC4DB8|nr:leucine-rich repeat and coiled-coil domain-containing protein 1 isoform X2 [Homo sapiens]XP_054217377.1 leucine-rich repeat and coiled-coil domain-containing protein 1 isoform X2 [Homo sapiens]|eukprot:XP_016869410.1 leucine-rich repeat and coiled-coil domain-containing protein 1 isoform X2 [Homo sapiens]